MQQLALEVKLFYTRGPHLLPLTVSALRLDQPLSKVDENLCAIFILSIASNLCVFQVELM